MGIKRGTIRGLLAVAGALVERTFGVLHGTAMDALGVGPPPAVLGWVGGRFLGVVAGDLVTWLVGEDVSVDQSVSARARSPPSSRRSGSTRVRPGPRGNCCDRPGSDR